MAEHLEDHADVRAVDAVDFEVVQQLDSLVPFGVRGIGVAYGFQYFDFVDSCLHEVLGRLDDLEGDEPLLLEVPAQPHRGEVAPAQLARYVVSPEKQVPYLDGVVAPLPVVAAVLLLFLLARVGLVRIGDRLVAGAVRGLHARVVAVGDRLPVQILILGLFLGRLVSLFFRLDCQYPPVYV